MAQEAVVVQPAVRLKEESCSRCAICYSLCPFEALSRESDGKINLHIEKCQVCGLCYSSCPAKAIDIFYYDFDSLVSYLQRARQQKDSDILVIACKGASPNFREAENLFGVSNYIPLSVPCAGRIPEEIYLKALADLGFKRIYVLACDEDYCRFERGSPVVTRRIFGLNMLLKQFGLGEDIITLKRNSLKVKADPDKCIRCGNCVFYCPYEAVRLKGTEKSPSFNLELCQGCGICVGVCPAEALELENWERKYLSSAIARLLKEIEKPKMFVFRCQWASYPSLKDKIMNENVGLIDLPCAGRVDTYHILEAFEKGADAVMVVACPEEDCRMKKGSERAKHQVEDLRQKLSQIGKGKRLHFSFVSPRDVESFSEELKKFKQAVQKV